MYITLSCQDGSLTAAVQKEGELVSYMQFADMLLAYGRSSEDARARAIAGLICLRALELTTASQSVVSRNLKVLLNSADMAEVDAPSKRFAYGELADLEFRDYVDKTFEVTGRRIAA